MQENPTTVLIDRAIAGDASALEALLAEITDPVFGLALRMLGHVADAQDATQEILLRVMTRLASFEGRSAFSTWVYRLSVRYLINERRSRFAHPALSLDFYGADIARELPDLPDMTEGVDQRLLAEELKYACTNVMLQCLDPEGRCIFVLGAMFRLPSQVASEVLGLEPATYRQRLHRVRLKMSDFLGAYCGLTQTGACQCARRVPYAISQGRLNPHGLEYTRLEAVKSSMEQLDDWSGVFANLPQYRSPIQAHAFVERLLHTDAFQTIQGGET